MSLRILFVEDSADDVELMLRRLREARMEPDWERVETEAALRRALADERWDLALVDFNLPGFGGPQALAVLAQAAPDVPAITVSGAIDEDTAVRTIKAGAVDYVLKDNLIRLAPAVQRAVEGADLRRQTRRAAEAARQSGLLYRRIVDMATEGIWAFDATHHVTFANRQMAHMLGYEPDELVGRDFDDFIFEKDRAEFDARTAARVRGMPDQFDARYRTQDGAEVWTAVSAVAELDAEGAYTGAFAMCTDITERRRAEAAIEAEEANLAAIFAASPVAMLVFDENTNVVRVNRAAMTLAVGSSESLLEYSPGSDLRCGAALSCVHHAEDPRGCGFAPDCPLCSLRQGLEFALAGGVGQRGVELALDLDREGGPQTLWLRFGAEAVSIDGAPHVIVALDDITERKRADDALRESEERFERFAQHFPGYLFMQDDDQRYVYVNRPGQMDGHVLRQDWIGKTPRQLWSGAETARAEERAKSVLGGEVVDFVELWDPPGQHEHLHSIHFPIARDGKPPLIGGLSVDVTEQVEAQDEVRRQAEQLRRTVEGAVLAMSHVVETRDPYTAGHERRVAELATALAQEMGMNGGELEALRLAALIHDIGKIAVPAEILAKPGRLSEVEFNLIRQHPQSGFEILAAIDFGRPVAEIVLQHHERLDGSGYPTGLSGEEILPEARILAVADVVEAMSSHRPYRAALGMEAALDEIRAHIGVTYDADVVVACVRLVEERGFELTP